MLARLRSRKEFLKMMGTVGVVTTVGQNVLLGQAFAQTPTDSASSLDPTKLTFKTVKQYRPFGLISDNFVDVSDSFDKNTTKDYTILSPAPELQGGKTSIGGGSLSVKSNGGAKFFALFRTSKITLAPYATVIVDVKSFIGSATNEDSVFAGLVKDDSNYVGAWYNNATKKVRIEAVVGGMVNKLVEADATLAAPVRFAFVLNSKEVTALADTGAPADTGGPWKPLANFPNPPEVSGDPAITPGLSQYVDLRDPAVLAQYGYGFGVRGDSGPIVLDGVEAGYWGRAGVRDPHVVTYADGTPYIKDNKLYLTLTNAGCDFFDGTLGGLHAGPLQLHKPRRPARD